MAWQNTTISMGPYYVLAAGKVLGQADNLTFNIAEATDAEISTLKNARIILLLKINKTTQKGAQL